MNKKIKIILTLFLFIVLLVFYFVYTRTNYYYIGSNKDKKNLAKIAVANNDPMICFNFRRSFFFFCDSGCSVSEIKSSCINAYARLTRDENICDLQLDIERGPYYDSNKFKFYCYRDVARIKNDYHICHKIENGFTQDDCLDFFIKGGAEKSICNENESCLLTYAGKNSDLSVCENDIHSLKYKDFCYSRLATNIEACKKISDLDIKNECQNKFTTKD